MTHNDLSTLIFRNFECLTHALLREKFWAPNGTGPSKIGLSSQALNLLVPVSPEQLPRHGLVAGLDHIEYVSFLDHYPK